MPDSKKRLTNAEQVALISEKKTKKLGLKRVSASVWVLEEDADNCRELMKSAATPYTKRAEAIISAEKA